MRSSLGAALPPHLGGAPGGLGVLDDVGGRDVRRQLIHPVDGL